MSEFWKWVWATVYTLTFVIGFVVAIITMAVYPWTFVTFFLVMSALGALALTVHVKETFFD